MTTSSMFTDRLVDTTSCAFVAMTSAGQLAPDGIDRAQLVRGLIGVTLIIERVGAAGGTISTGRLVDDTFHVDVALPSDPAPSPAGIGRTGAPR